MNKRAIEALIKAGAFDQLGESRDLLWASLELAMGAANQARKSEAAGMDDLFGLSLDSPSDSAGDAYLETRGKQRKWPERERLGYEKDTLGLYLTGHPMDAHKEELADFPLTSMGKLKPHREARPKTAALILGIRNLRDRANRPLSILTLDDGTARLEAIVSGDLLERVREKLVTDAVVIIEGRVSFDERNQSNRFQVDNLWTLSEARKAFADFLEVRVDVDHLPKNFEKRLTQIFQPVKGGGCPVEFYITGREASGRVRLGAGWDVEPTDELVLQIGDLLGERSVRFGKKDSRV